MNDCYNLKEVKAVINITSDKEMLIMNSYAGGVNAWNAGMIDKCYNEDEVHAISKVSRNGVEESYSGGIAGVNFGTVHKSRNMGKAYADSSASTNVHVHSIAGKNEGSIIDSF